MIEKKDDELAKILYKSFLNGNKNDFNEIVKIYQNQLINFIIGYVHNKEVAEDLAQDTFLYLIINKKEYDFKCTLKTYLYTIAKCRAINYLKREKRKIEFDEKYLITDEIDFEENIQIKENTRIIREEIKNLKREYQEILYLKELHYFEYDEICKILNKTIIQVRTLNHRARKALKRNIERKRYKYEE